MYSLHLTHPKWTHTRSSGQPCYSARGAVGGSVPCSRTPQSWYWRRILPPPTIPAGPEIRTHNLLLTSPTRYPLGHDFGISICMLWTSKRNIPTWIWQMMTLQFLILFPHRNKTTGWIIWTHILLSSAPEGKCHYTSCLLSFAQVKLFRTESGLIWAFSML